MSDHNPYAPPNARLDGPPGPPPRGALIKGLLAGLAVDIGGSLLLGVVLTFVYSIWASMQGQSTEEIMAALQNIPHDSWLYIIGATMGGACSFAGGYVCARIARQREVALGIIQSVCSVVSGLFLSNGDLSFGMQIALYGLSVLLIMLGIRLGIQRNRRELSQ